MKKGIPKIDSGGTGKKDGKSGSEGTGAKKIRGKTGKKSGRDDNKNASITQLNIAAAAFLSETAPFEDLAAETLKVLSVEAGCFAAYLFMTCENEGMFYPANIASWRDERLMPMALDFGGSPVPESVTNRLIRGERVNLLDGQLSNESAKSQNSNKINSSKADSDKADGIRKELFAVRGVGCALFIPIFNMGEFWGFTVFEGKGGGLAHADLNALRSGSIMLAAAYLSKQRTEALTAAANEAIDRSRIKSEFISRMSHEIRTPMNAVIGMNTIAKKSDDIKKIKYCLQKISSASDATMTIINDILDVSKIEAGRLEITNAEFDFEKMLQRVLSVIQVKVSEKEQLFSVDVGEGFFNNIISDEQRLSQVIIRLLTNAVKHTPKKGTVKLKISHTPISDVVARLRVEIRDNRVGLPDDADKLFDSLIMPDDNMVKRFGSVGLGLYISQRIINMMGGEIFAESGENRGSAFIFEIPVKWGQRCAEAVRGELDFNTRILVIDDSEDVCEYFESVLTGYSLSCDSASSGYAALLKVKKAIDNGRPYDMVFVDWKMPGLSGAETIRELKKLTVSSAVVMMSVEDFSDIEREAGDLDIVRFLHKPVRPSVLYNTIIELTTYSNTYKEKALASKTHLWEGKTILVAEDMEINREIIVSILEETNVAIITAEDGAIAVEMFKASPDKYDLILMDVQMPRLNGLSATREIRYHSAERSKTIPIIAMTANAFKEDVEECIRAGMNSHIAKPLSVPELIEKLSYYLEK